MITGLKVSVTKLLRINFDARTCRRYSGKTQTHGFVFDKESDITPALVGSMLAYPDSVGEVEKAVA